MELYKSAVAVYATGLILNYGFTFSIHKIALTLSKKKININFEYLGFLFYLISPDYIMAKNQKNKIRLKKISELVREETEDEIILRRFIQISNWVNLLFSLIFLVVPYAYIDIKIMFFVASFILIRSISRSIEITYAFTKDVIKKENKSSRLTSGERIILGINSYVEIILNYSLVYYILALTQSEIKFGDFSKINDLSDAIFRSVGISSFTGIGVNNFDFIAIIQLFSCLSLVYFAFASYIGNKDLLYKEDGEIEMRNINFRKIEDEARFNAQVKNLNKNNAASEALKKSFCEVIPEAENLYQDVNNRVEHSCRTLIFEVNYGETNYTAKTLNCGSNIYVEFQNEKANKRLNDVFIHELGEVDYIARNLPDVEDQLDRERIKYIIIELFSHKHIHDLSNIYSLQEENLRADYRNQILNKDFVGEQEPWKTVLDICWNLISFPQLKSNKEELRGYINNSQAIEAIIDIVENTNTLVENIEEIRCVEININKVLDILKECGLSGINVKTRIQ